MTKREFLIHRIGDLGLTLSERQAEQFEMFYEDLIEKNRVMNLTAITAWEDVVVKHFVDSLAIVKICDLNKESVSLIDVGTGAGFPGIPLAIMFPDIKIVMVDSVRKKVSFIMEEIEKLQLSHAAAVHGRVEDLARQQDYREKFDFCVSRAVANLSTLSEYCLPFVKKGGYFIAYKSGNCQQETDAAENAIRLLSAKIVKSEKYLIRDHDGRNAACSLQSGDNISMNADLNLKKIREAESSADEGTFSRTLIEIKKTGVISLKYPRKAGIPSKSPLG